MSLPVISPAEARRRLMDGTAVLIDIREPMERAREAIPGTLSCPLSASNGSTLAGLPAGKTLIYHCQSGRRTLENEDRLACLGSGEILILEGGLSAWKAAGYPTRIDRSRPIEMQRQVQIVAGALVFAGVMLSWLVHPVFLALAGFVGMGLMFAGISGWCGMGKLLGVLPWNRRPAI
ncbi:MAG: rhodanese family protein [Alphaproteobacteria bacterium]|nr:rhodanese family protein [Alphaproteobacteria bacterium]